MQQIPKQYVEAAIITVAIKTALRESSYSFAKWFLVFFLLSSAYSWLVGNFERDSTDGVERSGMKIHTDAKTGCEYLTIRGGGITPRIDNSGKPICGKY